MNSELHLIHALSMCVTCNVIMNYLCLDKSSGNGLESGTVIVHTPNCDDLVAAANLHNPTAIHLGHHTNMQREEVVTSEHLEQLNQIRAQHMIQQSEMHSNEQVTLKVRKKSKFSRNSSFILSVSPCYANIYLSFRFFYSILIS